MKLIKRSIQICFLPSLTISRALARVCTLCFTLTTFYLLFVYLSVVRKCVSIKTEHGLKRCGFCDILSQTLLLYLCKIQCMYACKCFRPNVATPMAKKKNKKWKKKIGKKTKNRLIAAAVQKFPPTSNLLNEEKKSFICDIFRDICSSMVYLNNKNLKEKIFDGVWA